MPSAHDRHIDWRLAVGFALFSCWMILYPRMLLIDSTTIYRNGSSITITVLSALAVFFALSKAGIAKPNRILVWAALAICAGGSIILPLAFSYWARLAIMGIQVLAALYCLYCLLHALGTFPPNEAVICCLWTFTSPSGAILLFLAVGALFGLVGNLHQLARFILSVLTILPIAIALMLSRSDSFREALAAPLAEGPVRQPANGTAGTGVSILAKAQHAVAGLPRNGIWIASFLLGSMMCNFANGFNYIPYLYDWGYIALLRALISGSIGIVLIASAHRNADAPTLAFNALFALALGSTVAGLAFLASDDVLCGFFSRVFLGIGIDCFFSLGAVFILQSQNMCSRSAFLPLCLLGMGWVWMWGIGLAFKQITGYDPSIIAPAASISIAALTVVSLSTSFVRSNQPDETPTISQDACNIDVEQAEFIVEKTRREILEGYGLSPRETQVALLTIDGLTAQTVSDQLGISIATVKFHLGNTYKKLDILSKAELIQRVDRAHSNMQLTSDCEERA